MSLEPLPWQPVANGSLGFPLHLQPLSWEYHSHGNGWRRSRPGHRLGRAQKAPFPVILGIFRGEKKFLLLQRVLVGMLGAKIPT